VREMFLSVLCLLLIFPPCFGRGNLTGPPASDADGTPFKVIRGFLIVFPGRMGSFTGLNFVLDTGTTHSTVNKKLAQRMRVPLRSTEVFDFDRFVTMQSGIFPEVQFGPVRVTDVSMLVADTARLSDLANGVDAIIGSDLLSLSNFSIDYDAQKLFFTAVQTDWLPLKAHPVAMILQVQVQGCPLDLLVDTGIESVVLFEDRLRGRMPQLRTEGNVDALMIGQQSHAKLAILPGVRLGPRTTELKVFLIKGPPGDVLSGIDGYWSTTSLKTHRIDFNFTMNKLSWQE
jgi:hypothetical protein